MNSTPRLSSDKCITRANNLATGLLDRLRRGGIVSGRSGGSALTVLFALVCAGNARADYASTSAIPLAQFAPDSVLRLYSVYATDTVWLPSQSGTANGGYFGSGGGIALGNNIMLRSPYISVVRDFTLGGISNSNAAFPTAYTSTARINVSGTFKISSRSYFTDLIQANYLNGAGSDIEYRDSVVSQSITLDNDRNDFFGFVHTTTFNTNSKVRYPGLTAVVKMSGAGGYSGLPLPPAITYNNGFPALPLGTPLVRTQAQLPGYTISGFSLPATPLQTVSAIAGKSHNTGTLARTASGLPTLTGFKTFDCMGVLGASYCNGDTLKPGYYGDLTVNDNDVSLILGEGFYSFGTIDIGSGSNIIAGQPNGNRTFVHARGNITASASNSYIGPSDGYGATGYGTGTGQFLGGTFMLLSDANITLPSDMRRVNNAGIWATVSAPRGDVHLNNQVEVFGQIFAKRIIGDNNIDFGEGAYIGFDPEKPVIMINRGSPITIREGTTAPCVGCKDTTITVTLSKANAFNVTLNWELLDGDGGPLSDAYWGTDFTTPGASNNFTPLGTNGGLLTIAANTLSTSFTIRIKDDAIYTGNRSFRIRLFNPGKARFDTTGTRDSTADTTRVTIIEDDPGGFFSFVTTDTTVAEGVGKVRLGVKISEKISIPTTIDVVYVPGRSSATQGAGADYTFPSPLRLSFAANDTIEWFDTLIILQDQRYENAETAVLALTNQSAGSIQSGKDTARITITDDDAAPAIRIANASVKEPAPGVDSIAKFVVKLVNAGTGVDLTASDIPERTLEYRWFTADSTAKVSDGDYVQVAKTLRTFPAGTLTDTLKVVVKGNGRHYEGNEYFYAKVDSFVNINSTSSDKQAVGTIQDLDAPPALKITGDSIREPNSPVVDSIRFIVTLLRPYSGIAYDTTYMSYLPTYYTWWARDQSARAGADYENAATTPKQRFVPARSFADTFYVRVLGDNRYEGRETFLDTIVPGANAFSGSSYEVRSAQGVILDNEPRPGLCIADTSVDEGDPPANPTMRFRVFLGDSVTCAPLTSLQAPELPVSFVWNTTDGSARQPADYTAVPSTPDTIPANSLSKLLPVTVKGDSIFEGDENLNLVLSASVGNGIRVRPNGVGTITDDDERPTISVTALDSSEGNAGTKTYRFVAKLSYKPVIAVSFDWTTRDTVLADTTGAKAGQDYMANSATGVTIPAGSDSTILLVTVNGDTKYEKDEIFKVVLTPRSGLAATGNTLAAIGTIRNDDAMPTIASITGVSDVEGNTGTKSFVFKVKLSTASGLASTFVWSTQGDTGLAGAKSGEDFVGRTNIAVTIPPDVDSANISVTVNGDLKYERDETFRVTATSGSGLTASNATATGVIRNDDNPPEVRILNAPDVTEPAGSSDSVSASFKIALSAKTGVPVQVVWATSDSSARASQLDYRTTGGTVTFAQDVQDTIVVNVPVFGDGIDEPTESFWGVISSATNASRNRDSAVTRILDTDPQPGIHVDPATVTEPAAYGAPAATATVRVWIDSVSGQDVSFRWNTRNGTATFGTGDYDSAGEVLRKIPAGQTFVNLPILVRGDSVANEGTETFRVALSNVVNASGNDTSDVVSIVDATPKPTLSIAQSDTLVEDEVDVPVAISLDYPSAVPVTVVVKTVSVTATAGADYRMDSLQITIPALTRSYTTYTSRIHEDNRYETAVETYRVVLDTAVGAVDPNGKSILVGIQDDEAVPTLSIDNVTRSEPAAAGATATARFTVTLSGPSELPVTVNWKTDSAKAAVHPASSTLDYTAASRALSFPADTVAKTIDVAVLGDSLDEYDETYLVRLSSPTVATLAKDTGVGVITDDDDAPLLGVVDPDTIAEGGTLGFVAHLERPSAKDVVFVWSTRDSTAIHDSDYVPVTVHKDTIKAFATSLPLNVVTLADAVAGEPVEVLLLKLDSIVDAGVGDTLGRGLIQDATGKPTLSIDSVGDFREPLIDSSVVFHVRLSTPSAQVVTVSFKTVSGTATVVADLADTSGVVTFQPGELVKDLPIRIVADAFHEIAREDFTVELSGGINAGILQPIGLGVILDQDAAPTISISDDTITEPAAAGSLDSAVMVVRLSAASNLTTSVSVATSDSTALSPADYLANGRTLVFDPGTTQLVFKVAVVGDSVDEDDEWFRARLSNPSNGILGDSAARVLVVDSDSAPNLSIASVSVNEGDTARITVTLQRPSARTVVFDWTTVQGTALGDIDYRTSIGTDSIVAGGTTVELRVPVYTDSVANELNETFRILITRLTGAALPDSDGVATIVDLTARPRVNVLAAGNVVEDPVFLVFPIVLDRPSSVPVRVKWKTQAGTATAGLDFQDTANTVVFAPGSVRDSLKVRVLEDSIHEPWVESLLVIISEPESASIGTDRAPGGIVDDNDIPSVLIDSAAPVVEGGSAKFPVRLRGISADSVVVWWHTIDGTAKAPADYASSSGRLVFKPGETRLDVSVATLSDSIWEPTEDFQVRIDSVRGAAIADSGEAGRRGKGSILEDGLFPTVSFDMRDTAVVEGKAGKVAVVVRLTRPASIPLETGIVVDASSVASRGADYGLQGLHGDTLAIPAMTRSVTFLVDVVDDSLDEPDELVRLVLKKLGNLVPQGKTTFDLTILDDDSAPEIHFDVDSQTVVENVGEVVVTADLTRPSGKPIDVWYSIGGTATAGGVDHDLASFHLRFEVGSTKATIRFKVVDDRIDEPDETVVVVLDSARNGNLKTPAKQIVLILDNDNEPTAWFLDTLKVVRENVGTVSFPIQIDHPSFQDVVLRIAVRGSAILDSLRQGSDAILDSDVVYEVRIPAGDTTGSFDIRVIDDGRVESTEDIALTLTGGTGADKSFKARSRLQILDNDAVPDVKITRPADSLRTKEPKQVVSWTWDGKAQPDKDTVLIEGWNRISRCATDTAGNTGCDTVHVWGDFTPPRVVITRPDSIHLTNKTAVRVCWTVIDSGATWRRVDSSRCLDTTLTEGTHTVVREACDSVGNCGRDQVIVTVDLTPPTGKFVHPPDSAHVRVIDQPARIRWIDDKDTIWVDTTLHMRNYGWNTFTATYKDKAGNVGTTSVHVYYEAPTVENGYYLDTDGDGKVDAAVVVFDSPWESDTLPIFSFKLGSETRDVETRKVEWKSSGPIGTPAVDAKGKVVVEYGDTVYLAPGTVMTDKDGKVIVDKTTGKPITSPTGEVYRDASGKVVYDSEGREMYRVPSPGTLAKAVPAKDANGKVVVVNGDTVFIAPGIVKTDKDGKPVVDSATGKPATVPVGEVYRDASGKIVYDSQGRQMYVVANPKAADRTMMVVHLNDPFKYGVTSVSPSDSGTMNVVFGVVDASGKVVSTSFQDRFPLADSVAPIIAKAVVVRTESYTGKDSVYLTPSEPIRFDSAGTWVEVKIDGKWHVVPAESLTVLKDGRIVILVEPGEDGSVRPGLEVRFGTGISDTSGNVSVPAKTKWATKVEGDPRPPLLEMKLPDPVKSVPASERTVNRDGDFVIRATDKSDSSGFQWWKPGHGYTNGSDPDIRNVCPDVSYCTGLQLYVNRPVRMILFIYDLSSTYVIKKEVEITQKDIDGLRADKLDRVRIEIRWNMRGENGVIVGSGIYLWRVVSYVKDTQTSKAYMTNQVVRLGIKSALE